MSYKIFVKYFIFGLIVSISLNYFYFSKQDTSSSNSSVWLVYEKVSTWSIEDSIDVVWNVNLVNEQSLKFNQLWKVVKVNFKEWDTIKKWDIIAELDKVDQDYKIQQANISLENANIKLKQLYDWVDDSQLLSSLKAIQDTKNNIIISWKQLESLKKEKVNTLNDIKNNQIIWEKDLEFSEQSLENSLNDVNVTISSQQNNLSNTNTNIDATISKTETSINSYILNLQKTLEEVDSVFWITTLNEHKNDSYETYISAKNSSYKNNTIDSFYLVNVGLNKVISKINTHIYWNTWELNEVLKELIEVNKNAFSMSSNAYNSMLNTIESTYFTATNISNEKNTFNWFKNTTQTDISSINSSIASLSTLTDTDLLDQTNKNSITQKQESIDNLKLSIDKKKNDLADLQISYDKTISDYDIKIEQAQNSLDILNKTLEVNNKSNEELNAWPKSTEIQTVQNSITQAEISLAQAKDWLKNYELEAPFDGVIKTIDFQVWDNLVSDSSSSVYIENPDLVEIKILLDQVDVVNVKLKDKAIIKFDAYPNEPVVWEVYYINTTPISNSSVISYEVKIYISDKSFSKKILSWMTSDVKIVTNSKNSAILISTLAIKTWSWESYVQVKTPKSLEKRVIETWLISWEKTEITDWLSVWEEILISDNTWTTSEKTTTKKATSIFPTWWRTGWWWWDSSQRPWN